jgi:hypothetical protein
MKQNKTDDEKFDNNIELIFKLEQYINTKTHIVEFPDRIHAIKFADKLNIKHSSNKGDDDDIFAEEKTADYKPLLEQDIKEEELNGKKIYHHVMKNLVLFKNTSLNNLLKLINSICQCDISTLEPVYNNKFNFIEKTPGIISYSNYVSIGSSQLHLKTLYNFKQDFGNQIITIIPWLTKNEEYITTLLKNTEKKTSMKINYSINELEINYYCTNPGISLNLPELFNLHSSTKKFKRIIIHDELLDIYNNRPMIQYIKQPKNLDLSTKHVDAKMNIITLFYSVNVTDDIVLESIDIYKNGSFKLIYQINNDIPLPSILSSIQDYFKQQQNNITEFEYLFSKLYLTEVNIGCNLLSLNDYVCKIGELTTIYSIPDCSTKDIKQLNKVFIYDEIQSRFKSNTSINFNQYTFLTEASLFKLTHEYVSNGIINESNFKTKLTPELHYTLDSSDNLVLNCTRFTSLDELVFALLFTLPLIKYSKLEDLDNETDQIKYILNKAKKIPTKTNLKNLLAKDPTLFAPRTVGKTPRSYSALCQKQEQRPVLLNESIYKLLKNTIPESVISLENQTYKGQRIYLLCPFDDFKYLNYHHINGQKCIVRCTSKLSNFNQYNHCSTELGADNQTEFTNKFENQGIIFYNDYLNENRKCYPPNELKNIFPEYILYKPKLKNEQFSQYCRRIYGLSPYIIQRDSTNKCYYLMTEFNENENYMLCLETENRNSILIFADIKTNNPLEFEKNKSLKDFFKAFVKSNPLYVNLIDYICEHVLIDYSINVSKQINNIEKIKEESLFDFIKLLYNKYNCKFVYHKSYLHGIIKTVNNEQYYYPIPKINWLNVDDTYIKATTLLKDLQNGRIKLPSFKSVYGVIDEPHIPNQKQIEVLVKPSVKEDKIINGIKIHNQFDTIIIQCEPCELSSTDITNYLIYDTEYYYNTLFVSKITNIKVTSIISVDDNMINFIESYVEKYSKQYPDYTKFDQTENINKFIEYMDNLNNKYNIIYDSDNKFNYITENTLSLTMSRINRNDMIKILNENKILFNEIEINKYIYNKLVNILKLHKENNEIILEKPFI